MLNKSDVPVAASMLHLGDEHSDPFVAFFCYWTAFNNCYTKLFEMHNGPVASLRADDQGQIITKAVGSVRIPAVKVNGTEREQLRFALTCLSLDVKNELIRSNHTRFFLERTPRLGGEIQVDALGQQLNGVINVGHTSDTRYPVWSPIDRDAYDRVRNGRGIQGDVDLLSEQLLNVLYTIRNNLVHAGKRRDDATDVEVVKHGLPLLKLIVESLISS